MSHTHTNGKSWNDRELEKAPLTTTALEEAAQAIVKTINDFSVTPEAEHKKGDLFNRIVVVMGTAWPQDPAGNPTLKAFQRNKGRLPETIGEMKQRIDRLANNLSDDLQVQDMCRAASDAAVAAAKISMSGKGTGKH